MPFVHGTFHGNMHAFRHIRKMAHVASLTPIFLVPGCVSAEPDGMSYRELRDLLAAIAERANVAGFDLVEVNPQLDVATG